MRREILHINTDDFYASAMRLRDPGLRGRPVVVSGPPPRGMVISASYEARSDGVSRGMTVSSAERLCPGGSFVRPDWAFFREVSGSIFGVLRRYSPVVEAAGLDEGYIDYTGCSALFGHVLDAGRRIKREVRGASGLDVSLGVASSRLVSHVASRSAKRAHMVDVYPGCESSFLAPVAISQFPLAGDRGAPVLEGLGIHSVGDILMFSEDLLSFCLGPWGRRLYRGALGKDSSAVRGSGPYGGGTRVERVLQPDVDDRGLIESFLYDISEELGQKLRADRLAAGGVRLEIAYADSAVVSAAGRPAHPTSDDFRLFDCAGGVLDRVLRRRVRVRRISLEGCSLEPEPAQLGLFPTARDKADRRTRRLRDSLDRLRSELPKGVAPVFGRSVEAVRSGDRGGPDSDGGGVGGGNGR